MERAGIGRTPLLHNRFELLARCRLARTEPLPVDGSHTSSGAAQIIDTGEISYTARCKGVMTESNPESWTETTSGRERVREVVELLDGPTPVQTIAGRAEVSRATADDELQRLQSDDWVTETTVDGTKAYDLNPVRMLFDELTDLIDGHSRDELESQLTELTEAQEALASEYDVGSLDEFREQLADEEFSAEELRERRNVIATWEAINTELGLVKHALQLYDDVVELSSLGTDSSPTLA